MNLTEALQYRPKFMIDAVLALFLYVPREMFPFSPLRRSWASQRFVMAFPVLARII